MLNNRMESYYLKGVPEVLIFHLPRLSTIGQANLKYSLVKRSRGHPSSTPGSGGSHLAAQCVLL